MCTRWLFIFQKVKTHQLSYQHANELIIWNWVWHNLICHPNVWMYVFFLQQTQTHWHSVILKHVISFMSFWICMVGIIFNENLWYKGQNLWWSILMKVGNVSILTEKYYNWYNSSIIKINKVFNIFFQLNCFFLNKYLYSYENILPNWCYLYVFRKSWSPPTNAGFVCCLFRPIGDIRLLWAFSVVVSLIHHPFPFSILLLAYDIV